MSRGFQRVTLHDNPLLCRIAEMDQRYRYKLLDVIWDIFSKSPFVISQSSGLAWIVSTNRSYYGGAILDVGTKKFTSIFPLVSYAILELDYKSTRKGIS